MKSTVVPSFTVSFAVVAAYHLGRTSGVGTGHNAGLFGTAVATMGMLSSACYVLSMNNYGPIADNAGRASQKATHMPPSAHCCRLRTPACLMIYDPLWLTLSRSAISARLARQTGGIAEMSQQPEFVRESTDRLDAAGNVTKAITKGKQCRPTCLMPAY